MDITLQRIVEELKLQNKKKFELTDYLNVGSSNFGNWISGRNTSYTKYIHGIAEFLGVSVEYLKGITDDKHKKTPLSITDEYIEFPVIGEVAAGYDYPAVESWDGETVKIPIDYLKGRNEDEFFVLSVKGDSMSPLYMNGDKVLVLKQSTMNYSGQIGVVRYDGDFGTLKRVEYVMGEDWMRLVPINDTYRPVLVEGADLEQCQVLGIPERYAQEIGGWDTSEILHGIYEQTYEKQRNDFAKKMHDIYN